MLRVLMMMLFMPFAIQAEELPQPLNNSISDFAQILNPSETAALTERLQSIRQTYGVHLVVVTMDRIASNGSNGQSIETYGKNLFNAWGIGDANKDDGILLLVAKDDREVRIALGSGYDVVYDGYAQRAIDTAILPEFRNGNYGAGIIVGVEAITERIIIPFVRNETPKPLSSTGESAVSAIVPFALFIIAALGIWAISARDRIRLFFARCPDCASRGLQSSVRTTRQPTRTLAGEGIEMRLCRHCGKSSERIIPLPMPSTGSNSGGGFGGGSSSGGGATGRW